MNNPPLPAGEDRSGMEKANSEKISPQALNFQSPVRAISPVFGSPSQLRGGISQAASPVNNSTFSANLRALIGDDESIGSPKKPSVNDLAEELARLRGEFQAQLDAMALKFSNWRSKDQRDRYRDRELLLGAIRKSATKIKESVLKVNKIHNVSTVSEKAAQKNENEESERSFLKSKIEVSRPQRPGCFLFPTITNVELPKMLFFLILCVLVVFKVQLDSACALINFTRISPFHMESNC